MQRLGVTLGGGHRLDAGAGHVVERVLGGQRPARCLRMRAQRLRFRVLGVEVRDQFAPQQPARTQLGHLHEEVHPDAPEERQPRRELVDVQARIQTGLDVLDAVGERVCQLQIRCGAGFLDVVAGDGDRIELRHPGAGVAEDVGDDPHRRLGRIDVGVADHELLEDVVLDGPGQLLRRHALLLGGHHVQREDRQHRTVHRHGHRHRRQVDAVEQLAHVENGIDCDTGHSDVSGDARVIGVIAAVGGKVECDRQTLLPPGEVTAVKGVGLRGGGEPGVLPDRPRLVDIHRRIRPPHVRRLAGKGVQRIAGGDGRVPVGGDVDRLDVDPLGGGPVELLGAVAVCGGDRGHLLGDRVFGRLLRCAVAVQRDVGEASDSCRGSHLRPPIW